MSLFQELAKQALGGGNAASQEQTARLLRSVLEHLSKPESGGIDGLQRGFQQQGLGDLVASWISTGQNQPVSGQQLSSVLGSDLIGRLAEQAGLSQAHGSSLLAQLLPVLIDQLTPRGQAPQRSQLLELGLSVLGSLGAARAAMQGAGGTSAGAPRKEE